MRIVWDLDGTLVHTREANWHAYTSVGVQPPSDFHVRPWQEWCSPKNHDAKGRVIGTFMQEFARPTPLLALYTQLGGTILTNASSPVVAAVIQKFPQINSSDILGGMTPEDKVRWLAAKTSMLEAESGETRCPGLYLDDSKRTVKMVRECTGWRAAVVQF